MMINGPRFSQTTCQMPSDLSAPELKKLLAIVWCLGLLHELEAHGLMDGSSARRLTPKGLALYDRLKAEAYIPSDELIADVLKELCGPAAQVVLKLIRSYLRSTGRKSAA